MSSLSHRELEEVLSKSRKNRSRKKSGGGVPKGKIPVEPTTSIAGAVPIDANKSSSEDSKLVDEPSRGEVGAEIEDSKGGHDASIESPLRVTRLLPALMGVDAGSRWNNWCNGGVIHDPERARPMYPASLNCCFRACRRTARRKRRTPRHCLDRSR